MKIINLPNGGCVVALYDDVAEELETPRRVVRPRVDEVPADKYPQQNDDSDQDDRPLF